MILSSVYNPSNQIYYVRNTFLRGFGSSLSWWLCLVLILLAVVIFEFAVQSAQAAFFTSDEDVFRALEKDPLVKRRFEEAASEELQNGWDKAGKGERTEEQRREGEIKDLLSRRVETVDVGEGQQGGGDVDRILSRGFGDVKVKRSVE
jgi:phospholipid-translocating ATPase